MINWRSYILPAALNLYGSNVLKFHSDIKSLQNLTHEKRHEYQRKQLFNLLNHAKNHIPYWKNIFTQTRFEKLLNYEEKTIDLSLFNQIPLMKKNELNKNLNNFSTKLIPKDHGKVFINHSGGSTGEPVSFYQSEYYRDWNYANKLFYKTDRGYNLGDTELRIWGSERDITKEDDSLKEKLQNFITNRVDLNAFKMDPAIMRNYAYIIHKNEPVWIEGYADALYEFAAFCNRNSIKLPRPEGVLSSAGTMYPYMYDELQEAFNCAIHNRYGSREVGDMACSRDDYQNLEISWWNQYVEIIPQESSEFGKLLVTNLKNYATPFIRYEIGDIAIPSDNERVIQSVEGREMDVIRLPNGTVVSGIFYVHYVGVVFNKGNISKFKVIQHSPSEIEIKYVSKERIENSLKYELQSITSKILSEKTKLKFTAVNNIAKLPSGKYQYIESRV